MGQTYGRKARKIARRMGKTGIAASERQGIRQAPQQSGSKGAGVVRLAGLPALGL